MVRRKQVVSKRYNTQAMLIGSSAKLQNISDSNGISSKFVIDEKTVLMVNEARYLGVQIDETLS